MQPVFGRFSALRTTTGSLIFVRLQTSVTLQLIHASTAYTASLSPTAASPARIRACTQPVTPDLLALLLAIPHTTAALESSARRQAAGSTASYQVDTLCLRCTDRAGVELEVCLPLEPACATPLLEEIHVSLFAAVVGLEAVVRESAGEKGDFLGEASAEGVCFESIKNAFRPLKVAGEDVQTKAVFRRASATDVAVQANRAFLTANGAREVRESLLGQRRLRREMEMEKMRSAREMVQRARKKAEEGKRRGEGAVGRKRKSLFDSVDEGDAREGGNSEVRMADKAVDEGEKNATEKDGIGKFGENEDDNIFTPLNAAVASDSTEKGPLVVKREPMVPSDNIQASQQRAPSRKKRRKRQLV